MMRIHRKRAGSMCAVMVLSLCMMTNTACANTGEEEYGAVEGNPAAYYYNNPKDIIFSQPANGHSTTSSKVSILGACDYDYPVYMNGIALETTEHGFFAEYVDLQMGKNTFTFTNNGKTKSIDITRNSGGSSGGSGGSSNKIVYWPDSQAPKYATAKGHNISRMSIPGGDSKSLMMPLAKGTSAQIIGEAGNLYCLSDYSFVYKSNVTVGDGRLHSNGISAVNLIEENGYDCTELQLSMSQNAIYNLERAADSAILTVYNTSATVLPNVQQNKIIKDIQLLDRGDKGYVKYKILFQDNAPINGHYVEFEGGKMLVGFKKRPVFQDESLNGVRIHIDAGHGGSDVGSKGPAATFGPLEKDINLSIALYAKEYLEGKGAEVIMTRTDDSALALSDRAAEVARIKPDFSLSIHCNSMPVTADYDKVKGFLTFYSFDTNGAAGYINSHMVDQLGVPKSTARYSNLAMTRMTGFPAVLFETAFMSNPQDYEWMIRKETQEAYGRAAGEAVERFLRSLAGETINTYA